MTKVINLYGAPGSGKSTIAAGLFYHIKMAGLLSDFILKYTDSKRIIE